MRSTARPLAENREPAEADHEDRDPSHDARPSGETPRSIALSRRRTLDRRLSDWLEERGLKKYVPWAGAAAALLLTAGALA